MSERNCFGAKEGIDRKFAAFFVAGAAVEVAEALDLFSADRAFCHHIAEKAGLAIFRHGIVLFAKHVGNFDFGEFNRAVHAHLAVKDLFERLTELRGFVFVHGNLHLRERFNEELSLGQNVVNVFFQIDIATLARVVDDPGARRLGAELQPLKDRAIVLAVVFGSLFPLFGSFLFILKGVFEIVVERFDRVVFGRRRFALNRREVDVDSFAFCQLRQDLVLLIVVIVFRPPRLENDHSFEGKALKFANVNDDLAL